MPRDLGAAKEKGIGWLMAGGLVVTVVSVSLLGLSILLAVFKPQYENHFPAIARLLDYFPATLIGVALGVLMMVVGLGYGLFALANQFGGIRQTHEQFRVLSRYCLDKNFNLLTADHDIEFAEKPRFYIRGMLYNGDVGEFETTIEVFYNAGEGMYGVATIQGNWIGSFVPYIGTPST